MTTDIEPVMEMFGTLGGPNAIIMSPILAEWDQGKFCTPLIKLLAARGYHVTVYDTISLARNFSDLSQVAALWGRVIADRHTAGIELVVGQAYGGAVAQYLLGSTFEKVSVSSEFLHQHTVTICCGRYSATS